MNWWVVDEWIDEWIELHVLHWPITDPHWAVNVFAAEYKHFGLERHGTWGPFRDKVWTWVISCCCCCCDLWGEYGAKYRYIKTGKETRCFQCWVTYWPCVSHKNERYLEDLLWWCLCVFAACVQCVSRAQLFHSSYNGGSRYPVLFDFPTKCRLLAALWPIPPAINYQKQNTGCGRVGLQWKELAVKYRLLCANNSTISSLG